MDSKIQINDFTCSLATSASASTPQQDWNYFLALDDDIERLSRYLELTPENFDSYSVELARILLAAASEVDVVAKKLCRKLEVRSNVRSIEEYRKTILFRYPQFFEVQVELPRFALTLYPWKTWKENVPPKWWTAYNKIKHHRHIHFYQANLKHTVDAVAALYVLLLFYYLEEAQKAMLTPDPKFFRRGSPFHIDQAFYFPHGTLYTLSSEGQATSLNISQMPPDPQVCMDAAVENYLMLHTPLHEDISALFESENNSSSWRRRFIRDSVAFIEGHASAIRGMSVVSVNCVAVEISKNETKVLRCERDFSADDRIKYTLSGAYKLFELDPRPSFKGLDWQNAKKMFAKRHFLMHPNTLADLEIKEDCWFDLKSGGEWLIKQFLFFSKLLKEKYTS